MAPWGAALIVVVVLTRSASGAHGGKHGGPRYTKYPPMVCRWKGDDGVMVEEGCFHHYQCEANPDDADIGHCMPDRCEDDSSCDSGFTCAEDWHDVKRCKPNKDCDADADCPADWNCVEGAGWIWRGKEGGGEGAGGDDPGGRRVGGRRPKKYCKPSDNSKVEMIMAAACGVKGDDGRLSDYEFRQCDPTSECSTMGPTIDGVTYFMCINEEWRGIMAEKMKEKYGGGEGGGHGGGPPRDGHGGGPGGGHGGGPPNLKGIWPMQCRWKGEDGLVVDEGCFPHYECETSPDDSDAGYCMPITCAEDVHCDIGFRCRPDRQGVSRCRPNKVCTTSDDCPEDWDCEAGRSWEWGGKGGRGHGNGESNDGDDEEEGGPPEGGPPGRGGHGGGRGGGAGGVGRGRGDGSGGGGRNKRDAGGRGGGRGGRKYCKMSFDFKLEMIKGAACGASDEDEAATIERACHPDMKCGEMGPIIEGVTYHMCISEEMEKMFMEMKKSGKFSEMMKSGKFGKKPGA